MSEKGTPTKRKNPEGGIAFFQHFPKDFLRPYGVATVPAATGTDNFIDGRIKHFTTEWLCRPGIAMSEFTDTISANWKRAMEDLSLLSESTFLEPANTKILKLAKLSSCFAKPGKDEEISMDEGKARSKVHSFARELNQMSDLDEAYIDTALDVGSSLYLMAIHIKVAKYIFNNLDEVSATCSDTNNLKEFKRYPTLETYTDVLVSDYLKRGRSTQRVNRKICLRDMKVTSQPGTSTRMFDAHDSSSSPDEVTTKEKSAKTKKTKTVLAKLHHSSTLKKSSSQKIDSSSDEDVRKEKYSSPEKKGSSTKKKQLKTKNKQLKRAARKMEKKASAEHEQFKSQDLFAKFEEHTQLSGTPIKKTKATLNNI